MENPAGGIAKVYENAVKLFQLGEKPVGIAVYGLAALGTRTIGSYIREFEVKNPQSVVTGQSTMKDITEQLRLFFLNEYQTKIIPQVEIQKAKKFSEIPDNQKPVLGLVVGGFSAGEYLSEVWEIRIPFCQIAYSAILWCGQGVFRPVWFSLNDPIVRYELGYDRNLIAELKQYFVKLRGSPLTNAEDAAIVAILNRYTYVIPFHVMPMEEGVAYVKFVVEMVINHHRFATGAPIVGGKVQIGLVTYKGEQFQILHGR
jgi:hypothetical protein